MTPLRVGQENYWLDQIARDRCEYYSAKGESPGWWAGALAEQTGLVGLAPDDAVHRLFAGQDPTTGTQRVEPLWRADPRSKLDAAPLLGALRNLAAARGVELADLPNGHKRLQRQLQALPRSRNVSPATARRLCRSVLGQDVGELYGDAYDQALKHTGKRVDARVAAFDLSFSDVKSVSLLAAGASADVRRQVQVARHAAIREVLAYLEREAVGVRRGHNGAQRHKGLGFTAAAFDHRTSRAGDPQWHTHVLVQNATLGTDQRWSALDSKLLHAHAMAADRLYHATLRAELTQRLDVRWREVNPRTGAAEIDGLHEPELLRAFSKRRTQVLAQQAQWGHHGIRASKAAALATRAPKADPEPEETFYQRVARGLADHGIGPAELQATMHRGRAQTAGHATVDPTTVLDWLASPDGLTARASTFARRDVLDALAKHLPVTGTAADAMRRLEQLADDFLVSDRAVPITIDRGLDEPRWSTPELLAVEQRLLNMAQARTNGKTTVVPGELVRAALAARPGLDADQEHMVRHVTQDGAGVSVVVGHAGSGKTYATAATTDAFRRAGHRVIPTAPTGVAAHQLEHDTGLPAPTADALLGQLLRREERLDARTVVVLDEAAMVGTRKLARLLTYTHRAHAKLILIGDDKQLRSIDTGGAFRALRQRLGACELTGNHRQQTQLGKDVAILFRTGRQQQALDQLVQHGKVTVCRTEAEANAAQVADWWQRFSAGQQAGMIAFTHAETTRLNTAAHQLMLRAGRLGPEALTINDREFRVGDHIVCGRNARKRLGIVNGTRATITALNPQQRTITIRTDDHHLVTLPTWYLTGHSFDRPWVDHAYAVTGHKTQALTGDDFSVRPSTRADAHWAYVTATRHRLDLRLYLVEEAEAPDDDIHHARDRLRDPITATLHAMQRPGEQLIALDQSLNADVRQMTTTDLRHERDRLHDLLASSPPSDTHRIRVAARRHLQAEVHLHETDTACSSPPGTRVLRRTANSTPSTRDLLNEQVQQDADSAAPDLIQLRRQDQQRTAFIERHAPDAARYLAVIQELAWRHHAQAHALEWTRPPTWLTLSARHPRRAGLETHGGQPPSRSRLTAAGTESQILTTPSASNLKATSRAARPGGRAIEHHCQDERRARAQARDDHEEQQREIA